MNSNHVLDKPNATSPVVYHNFWFIDIFYKVNVPVCGHLFIFFSINVSNDEKPYDNFYKHYPGIIRDKIDMSCRF